MSFSSNLKTSSVFRSSLAVFFVVLLAVSVAFTQEDTGEKDAVQIFNQGQDAHEKGDFLKALKFYDEAVKLAPEFPEAEFQRGNAFVSLNRLDEAERAFRRALELREDWTLPMTNLGALLVEKSNFAEAEKLLLKAIETDETNFSAFSALTELRLKTKAAPTVLRQLLAKLQVLTSKANPTAGIWASRAAVETSLSDKTAAKASLSRALAIEAGNKTALLERAEIALSEGDVELASADVKTVLQTAPESISAKLLQARIYTAQGKPGEALKILDALKNISSEAAVLRDTITANSSSSASDLEKLLERDAKNATVLSRLCTLLRIENPLKALEYCRRASEAEPDNVNHAVGFAAALVQAKQFENAVTVLSRILQIAPDNFTARANLATALFELKRYADAKPVYLWLTEKQPDLAIAYYFLAIAHDRLNEYPDALANYQQFLKRADAEKNKLEIEKVNLRLPSLQNDIRKGTGRKKKN